MGYSNMFLMVFNAILRQIASFCFSAISSREVSVCATFLRFFQLCFRNIQILLMDLIYLCLRRVHSVSQPYCNAAGQQVKTQKDKNTPKSRFENKSFTGWLSATAFYDFSLTDSKKAINCKTEPFSERFCVDILTFWCVKRFWCIRYYF